MTAAGRPVVSDEERRGAAADEPAGTASAASTRAIANGRTAGKPSLATVVQDDIVSADERRARFRELHGGDRLFLMPNPWDVGSARLLEALGFPALATTSAGFAWSLGRPDQHVTRDELAAHVEAVATAVSVPLNVDSERLYPDEPGGVAETVRLLAEAGASGCSIEDFDPATRGIDYDRGGGRAGCGGGGRGARGRNGADRPLRTPHPRG